MYLVTIKISLSVFCTCCVYQYSFSILFSMKSWPTQCCGQKVHSDIGRALCRSAEEALLSQVYTQVKRHPILIWSAASSLTVKYGLCLKFQSLEISSLPKEPKHLRQPLWIVCNARGVSIVSVFTSRSSSVHCLTKHLDSALIWKVDSRLFWSFNLS